MSFWILSCCGWNHRSKSCCIKWITSCQIKCNWMQYKLCITVMSVEIYIQQRTNHYILLKTGVQFSIKISILIIIIVRWSFSNCIYTMIIHILTIFTVSPHPAPWWSTALTWSDEIIITAAFIAKLMTPGATLTNWSDKSGAVKFRIHEYHIRSRTWYNHNEE